ncbi:MAG: signal peptidase I [Tannerella sp.]|jgi:signal peptidase I|nr:signal peptidase I [Tannerella sp.]
MKQALRYIVFVLAAITVVVAVRLFLLGSYHIKSNHFSDSISTGDRILVNKLKTDGNPGRGRLILYSSPLKSDEASPPLFAGRVVGMPGDVIQTGLDGFRVNGKIIADAKMTRSLFRVRKDVKRNLLDAMDALHIPLRNVAEDAVNITLSMSIREKNLLMTNLDKVISVDMIESKDTTYSFVIPRKGHSLVINSTSLISCKEALTDEGGTAVKILDGKLFINGVEQHSFHFNRDYYWVLSEDETGGIDSRHLGLIPKDHIIGNMWFCWFSRNPAHRWKKIK